MGTALPTNLILTSTGQTVTAMVNLTPVRSVLTLSSTSISTPFWIPASAFLMSPAMAWWINLMSTPFCSGSKRTKMTLPASGVPKMSMVMDWLILLMLLKSI